jgi:hypothetical protein
MNLPESGNAESGLDAFMGITTHSESDTSSFTQTAGGRSSGRLKVGVVAAASALAGGLAAAWWYRNTLKTLRQTGETSTNPHFGIPADESGNEG